MKRTTAAVCGLSRILFAAGVFCWFFYFFTVITGPETAELTALVPIASIALSYCAGVIASRRGIKVLVYILIQIVLCAGDSRIRSAHGNTYRAVFKSHNASSFFLLSVLSIPGVPGFRAYDKYIIQGVG